MTDQTPEARVLDREAIREAIATALILAKVNGSPVHEHLGDLMSALMEYIEPTLADEEATLAADLALAAAVREMPRTVWLGRVPEGWCVLTDNGTDEGKPHIAPDPLAAIIKAAKEAERE